MKNLLIISVLTIALFSCKKNNNSNSGANTSLHTIKYVITGSNCEVITLQFNEHPDTVLKNVNSYTIQYQVPDLFLPFNPSVTVGGGNNYSPALQTDVHVNVYWDNNYIGEADANGMQDYVEADFTHADLN